MSLLGRSADSLWVDFDVVSLNESCLDQCVAFLVVFGEVLPRTLKPH